MAAKSKNVKARRKSIFAVLREQMRYAWNGTKADLLRQPWATLLTMMVIAISLTLPTVGYLIWKNVDAAAQQWYPTPQLTVYLQKSLNEQAANELVNQLKKINGVSKINYLPRDKALSEFRAWSGYDAALDMLDNNPLPPVAIITPSAEFQQTESLIFLRSAISIVDGVDEVRLDDSWFTRLMALTRLVAVIAGALALLMVVAVFLVIGNSVRLNIFSRRETINVMKLIGATDGFILRPFLNGGALLGFFGALLALIMSQLLVWGLSAVVSKVANVFNTSFMLQGLSWDEALLLLLVATMIGWMAAWLATVQHLRHFTPE